MSGHSKWANIKHKKGKADAKKGKIFSRIVKEITIAIKDGGSTDPDYNPALRLALNNAKGANMPNDNVERAIKKAKDAGENLEAHIYEGTGPEGIAVYVECLSDNSQRTVSSVRHAFSKYNGNLGKNGSLSYLFDRKGIFTVNASEISNMEDPELELIDAGLEETEKEEDKYYLTVEMADFGSMQNKLEELKIEVENAELQRIPKNERGVSVETALKAMKLIEFLEEDDDVQNVFHDMKMTDEIAKALEEEE
ncbi:MAG: YebC/PmpR family DNA-binding transcriptional regulator [Bacteroidota bacterium]|nr:YebC/PmpR family DNA-binding transcriptional regulator [Bacteroidota bacterium]